MKSYKYLFLVVILMSSTIAVKAQLKLSLGDAVELGLKNNYQIELARQNIEKSKNLNSWGATSLAPIINIGAVNINRFDNDYQGERYLNAIAPTVNLSWTFFNGFSAKQNKEKFELLEDFSVGNQSMVIENTIQAIMLAYYKGLVEREKLEAFNKILRLSSDRYHYMLERKKIGTSVTFDVLQAQNAHLSDSSNFLLQKLNYETTLRNLALILAVEPNVSIELIDSLPTSLVEFEKEVTLTNILTNNRLIKNQFINLELLRKDVDLAKSALFPSLSFGAGLDPSWSTARFVNEDPVNAEALGYYANFSLNYNLFNGGNKKRAIDNARITEIMGGLEIDELKHTVSNSFYLNYDQYEIRKQLLRLAEENLNASNLNLELAEQKFRSGAINSFNYRDVQLLYINAELNRLQAIFNLKSTETELLKMSGQLLN